MKLERSFGKIACGACLLLAGGGLVVWWMLRQVPQTAPESGVAPISTLVVKAVEVPEVPIKVSGEPRSGAVTLPASPQQALYNKDLPLDPRLRAINDLGPSLGDAERTLLLTYVKTPKPDDGLRENERNGLKNDILNVLRAQTLPVADLAPTLIAIAGDDNHTPIMRDYALQHLSEYRAQVGSDDPTQAEKIDAALWNASREHKQLFAGTALLALTRIVEAGGGSSTANDRLEQAVMELAADTSAPLGSRITALSVAGRMSYPGIMATAVHALDSQGTGALKVAALSTLGMLRADGVRLSAEHRQALSRIASTDTTIPKEAIEELLAD